MTDYVYVIICPLQWNYHDNSVRQQPDNKKLEHFLNNSKSYRKTTITQIVSKVLQITEACYMRWKQTNRDGDGRMEPCGTHMDVSSLVACSRVCETIEPSSGIIAASSQL